MAYIKRLKELNGSYGSGQTEDTILVAEMSDDSSWYCVEGSTNVNRTMEELEDGVWVEELDDFDTFTASKPVESLDDLEREVES